MAQSKKPIFRSAVPKIIDRQIEKLDKNKSLPVKNKAVLIDKPKGDDELSALRKENEELKKRNSMLERMLMTAGVEIDEKFGDNEEHIILPSADQLKGYQDLGEAKPHIPFFQTFSPKTIANEPEFDESSEDW